jgi:hypothetical protein
MGRVISVFNLGVAIEHLLILTLFKRNGQHILFKWKILLKCEFGQPLGLSCKGAFSPTKWVVVCQSHVVLVQTSRRVSSYYGKIKLGIVAFG